MLEALDAEVVQWLAERHDARFAPELVADPPALRAAVAGARALIAPPDLPIDARFLESADDLCIVARLQGDMVNVDQDLCRARGVEVARVVWSSANAEAEFALGALLDMFRNLSDDGPKLGRELGCATVGLIGMTPVAQVLAPLLAGFGTRVMGYDPSLHASDEEWSRWGVEPLSLMDLLQTVDAVVVLLPSYERFRGVLSARVLSHTRMDQVWVALSPSMLFDELALSEALNRGAIRSIWFDALDPSWLEAGRPLARRRGVRVTERQANQTREAATRAAWAIARRVDEVLSRDVPAVRAAGQRSR